MNIDLPPLSELTEQYRRDAEEEAQRWAKSTRERAEERIKKAETNRQALALLVEAGIEISSYSATCTRIEIGFFPHTPAAGKKLADAVRQVREALGCRIHQDSTNVYDHKKKLVEVVLKPVDYPTVSIEFQRKLRKDSKCKIVCSRSTYSTLICES
jgi:hypothetical protein